MSVRVARTASDVGSVRCLFAAYADFIRAAVAVDLHAHGYGDELDGLPGAYHAPSGCLLLASTGREARSDIGAVGLKAGPLPDACELKRLFVAASARGLGAGQALLDAAIGFAVDAGYGRMLLDTKRELTPAIRLYESAGFRVIPPYWDNPVADVICYALDIDGSAAAARGPA